MRSASGNARFSCFCTNENTSPPAPQPKHLKKPRSGWTWNDGDFSPWNGHSPTRSFPRLRRLTYAPITSPMSARARTSRFTPSSMRTERTFDARRSGSVLAGLDDELVRQRNLRREVVERVHLVDQDLDVVARDVVGVVRRQLIHHRQSTALKCRPLQQHVARVRHRHVDLGLKLVLLARVGEVDVAGEI